MLIFGFYRKSHRAEIPDSALRAVKKIDSEPVIKIFVLAHEGEAQPQVGDASNMGLSRRLFFSREAIASLSGKITNGLKGFFDHSLKKNRKEIAEIIHHFQDEVNGRLSYLAAVWIKDKKYSDSDIISLEANAPIEPGGIVNAFANIYAFALGRSGEMKPGFKDSVALETIYAMASETETANINSTGINDINDNDNSNKKIEVEEMSLTRKEIIAAINETGLPPSSFFDTNDMIGSIEVVDGKLIFKNGDSRITDILRQKTESYSLIESEAYKTVTESAERYKNLEPDIKESLQAKKVSELKTAVEELAGSRKFSKKFKAFALAESNLIGVDFENEKSLTALASDYCDQMTDRYKSLKDAGVISGDSDGDSDDDNADGDNADGESKAVKLDETGAGDGLPAL